MEDPEDPEEGGFVEISADGIQAQNSEGNTFMVKANGDAFFGGKLTSKTGTIAG